MYKVYHYTDWTLIISSARDSLVATNKQPKTTAQRSDDAIKHDEKVFYEYKTKFQITIIIRYMYKIIKIVKLNAIRNRRYSHYCVCQQRRLRLPARLRSAVN